jgi:two-component system sensor histidine kinase ResE
MVTRSIVAKLWLTIVSILVVTLIFIGFGLFKIVDRFYFSQITKNITYQGKQIAALYENYPETFRDNEELNRFSHVINAHTVVLDEKGVIQVCNAATHLSPGSVFKEEELSKIFKVN